MENIQIAVLGAGNMGTAVAQHLAKQGHRVWLWDYNPKTLLAIKKTGLNEKFLPGVKLFKHIVAEASMQTAMGKAQLVIIACASPFVRATARHLAHCLEERKVVIAHVAKGLAAPEGRASPNKVGREEKTFLTMHEIVQSELPSALRRGVVTISGPSIASEFVQGVPSAVVAASQDKRAAQFVRDAFVSDTFNVALSTDYRGVGVCGALKNVYGIALGMCDGMRLRMDAKAFMLTMALSEMERVVVLLGGKLSTVYGLAGIGDLTLTSLGESRSRALGERICKNGHCKFIGEKQAQTYEGVSAAKVFYELTRRKKLSAPLINLVYRVLYQSADPCLAVTKFFATVIL